MGNAGEGGGDQANELRLLSLSWNHDGTYFAAATTADFRAFDCRGGAPLREELRRVRHGGGYAFADMLFCTCTFAVVPGGDAGGHAVKLWDHYNGIRRYRLNFSSAVRAVRMSDNHLAVVFDRVIKVYELMAAAWPLHKIDTAPNPRGLCCLSSHTYAPRLLACPGTERGQVRIEHLGSDDDTRLIAAHGSDVACMALTLEGTVLATASVKGTLVRIFSTRDGTCLHEVRRGRDKAEIYSIALAQSLQWLAVSSSKGRVHVFSLKGGF